MNSFGDNECAIFLPCLFLSIFTILCGCVRCDKPVTQASYCSMKFRLEFIIVLRRSGHLFLWPMKEIIVKQFVALWNINFIITIRYNIKTEDIPISFYLGKKKKKKICEKSCLLKLWKIGLCLLQITRYNGTVISFNLFQLRKNYNLWQSHGQVYLGELSGTLEPGLLSVLFASI